LDPLSNLAQGPSLVRVQNPYRAFWKDIEDHGTALVAEGGK